MTNVHQQSLSMTVTRNEAAKNRVLTMTTCVLADIQNVKHSPWITECINIQLDLLTHWLDYLYPNWVSNRSTDADALSCDTLGLFRRAAKFNVTVQCYNVNATLKRKADPICLQLIFVLLSLLKISFPVLIAETICRQREIMLLIEMSGLLFILCLLSLWHVQL